MHIGTIICAAFLGAVAGVTALLPVSATGHIIFLEEALHFESPPGKVFEVSIQLGAVVAIGWFYRARLWHSITHPGERAQRLLLLNLAVALLPAALLGWVFHRMITGSLFHIWAVATTLFLGGIAILGVERWKPPTTIATLEAITPLHAFVIGLFQSIALIPGVSRLAASLLGGLLLGIERKAATEFSLFLAIPTVSAAAFFDIYANRASVSVNGLALTMIGVMMACAAAVAVIRWCVDYISSHGMELFGWYRVLIGAAMLAALLLPH